MTIAQATLQVSIVMPCLNEAETVATCVSKARSWLSSAGLSGEILVVDNGSTDSSPQLAEAAGARVIRERRRGYGYALLRGMAESRGEVIVMGDADDTYDFSDLDGLIEPLRRGSDLVLGNRFAGGIGEGAMPWTHRYIGSPIINFLIRRFIGIRVGDSQSGLRALTRRAYLRLRLRSGGMEFASEMLVSAAHRGLSVAEVPAPYALRLGDSKLNTVRDGWRHLRYLLVAAPNLLFVLPGLALSGAGLLVTALSFLAPEGVAVGSLTWQPVFAGSILLAVGVNALLFGLLSKLYLVRRGRHRDDRSVRMYRRVVTLERVLGLAGVLVLLGAALDGLLFVVWAGGGKLGLGLQLAALAQTAIVVGANLGMAGFLAAVIGERP